MNLNDLKQWLDAHLSTVSRSPEQAIAERNLLLRCTMGILPESLYREPEQAVEQTAGLDALQVLVNRRIHERLPVQYLIGEASFCGLMFYVSPDVLIPRPETELLVEKAAEYCKSSSLQKVLDLGTGSGCIAIALKNFLPHLDLTAIDLSSQALEIAQKNATRHQTDIRFLEGSWFAPVEEEQFDLIVANPPYIHRNSQAELSCEVLQEPHLALFSPGGPECLYQSLVQQAGLHLTPEGMFLFEMGLGQSGTLSEISQAAGFQTEIFQDYSGIDRIIAGML